MAITFVSSGEQNTSNDASPFTYTVDIGTRTNGLLVVFVFTVDTTTHTQDTPTWNGVAMGTATSAISETVTGIFQRTSIYYLSNPANGSNTFSVNHEEGASDIATLSYIVAAWFDGANQTQASVLDQINSGTGSTDPSLAITPGTNNQLVVAAYASEADAVLTAAHNLIQNQDQGTRTHGAQYVIQTTATTSTMSWSGTDANWIAVAASFKEAAGGSQQDITPNVITSTEAVYQPALTPGSVTVTLNLVSGTATVYQPAVSVGGVTITPAFVTSTEVVYQPAIAGGGVTITPNLITSTEVVYAPALSTGSVTVTPNLIASAEVVYAPLVTNGLLIVANFITSVEVVYAPALSGGGIPIAPDLISSTEVVYEPQVFLSSEQEIQPEFISGGELVYQVIVSLYNVSLRRTYAVEYEDRTVAGKR